MKKLYEYILNNNLKESASAEKAVEKSELFMSMLLEYNEKFNLTAITDKDEIEIKHFIDSLQGSKYVKDENLDIGSGAGFPGIPLAIVNPEKKFTLVDSLKKRVDFLTAVKEKCGLDNVEIYHKRAEDISKSKKYGLVTARAVAPLNILCEYCLPFVEIGGIMLAYKGKKADEETEEAQKAIDLLGGKVEKQEDYRLETADGESERKLIIIRKERETPEKYPRGGNKPRLKPITNN